MCLELHNASACSEQMGSDKDGRFAVGQTRNNRRSDAGTLMLLTYLLTYLLTARYVDEILVYVSRELTSHSTHYNRSFRGRLLQT